MATEKDRISRKRLLLSAGALLFPAVLMCQDLHSSGTSMVQEGKAAYGANCSGCHGTDGAGTEQAPRLAENQDLRGRSQDRLRNVIAAGFPAAGMPPFASLPSHDLDAIAAYVHSLNSPAAETATAGDPSMGRQFFRGNGKCGTCHMVHGIGSSIGPDLSDVGRRMTAKQINDVLLFPDRHITPGYELATVKTRNGQTVQGFVRGGSNYDLQLQDLSGSFHLLVSDDILSLTREKRSLMKPLAAGEEQLQNLGAYLSRLTGVEPGALEESNSQAVAGSQSIGFSKILDPKPGDWPTYNGNLDANRYSPLKQINPSNVKALALKWIFPMPQLGLEATPLVVDGVMYFSGQNQAYALDALTGRQIWRYFRPPTPGLVGDASVGTNRGVALLGDKVFVVTDNAHLLALNRVTGSVMWEVVMPEQREHYGSTVSPLIVNNTVIAGVSGGDWGIRGFIACYDAETGKLIWRHWTLPAKGEAGIETWGKDPPLLSGGSTWLTGSYDRETDTLYWPTGNPYPDSDDRDRPGDNLYTDCILAINPQTGALKWYYQFTPHDRADRDATEPPVLIDAQYRGKPRKLLLHADRNGFFYVLDRTTGEVLLAKTFLKQMNWATGISPDGRPQPAEHSAAALTRERECPNNAANWSSTAYSPVTRFYYVMTLEDCHAPEPSGGSPDLHAVEPSERYLRAIDIDSGKVAWEVAQPGPVILKTWSGVLATASGIVFYSDPNGAFVAVDERQGKTLWHYDTNVGMKGPPMTYVAGGKQYVAVTAGSVLLSFALSSP
ncbi:MAG TPA: PQQ-binding-like beta-propeller repeat protein [Acidobacteriaceae bacterium]|nr:PQQ-binding-like beta-propeller repeat protein [Acidobacteriaceae bacterium]